MFDLLSSPERLANPRTIGDLKVLFCAHGALGYRKILGDLNEISEIVRLRLVPLVFGLMPRLALERTSAGIQIKPSIREHLAQLGITEDGELVSVLKSVCDQYFETRKNPVTKLPMKRKFGISDIRANAQLFRKMIDEQSRRCGICGHSFDESTCTPTLDHIIPWRLIGDVPDGSNWQILCDKCNSAKGHLLSSLQSPYAINWIYGQNFSAPLRVSGECAFIALSQRGRCSVPGCTHTRRSSRLHAEKVLDTGLAIADNIRVVCESHATLDRSAA